MMKKILMTEPMHDAGMKALADKFEIIIAPDKSHETLSKMIVDVDALVVKLTKIESSLLDKGHQLKLLVKHAAGFNDIDVKKASANNILVLNAGDANANSVAEHALIAIGCMFKRVLFMDHATRRGDWEAKFDNKSLDLNGARLGLVGLGNIGLLLAKKAQQAFNMQILAYDPYIDPAIAKREGVSLVSDIDEICVSADAISIHTPLTNETKNLIDARRLALMKPSAILVNFARGGIVNETALYEVLKHQRILGAALDVFENEPVKSGNPLFALDNVLLSPHAAAYTDDCRRRISLAVAHGIIDYFAGRRPQFVVNSEVLQRDCRIQHN